MGPGHFTDDFKRDAVAQITERGYPVAEVSKRLGVSQHSLYAWKRKFSKPPAPSGVDQTAVLVEAAGIVLRITKKNSSLKTWGLAVARRRGMAKATVAVARRLAVILHRMWVDNMPFRWEAEVA